MHKYDLLGKSQHGTWKGSSILQMWGINKQVNKSDLIDRISLGNPKEFTKNLPLKAFNET